MSPDVDSLIVYHEERGESFGVRVEINPVATFNFLSIVLYMFKTITPVANVGFLDLLFLWTISVNSINTKTLHGPIVYGSEVLVRRSRVGFHSSARSSAG